MSASTTFGVSSGLLDAKHVRAIGEALWVFLALVDRQTSEDGEVNAGRPLQVGEIAARLGVSRRTCERHLARLEGAGYIIRTRTSYGFVYSIRSPKKRFRKGHSRPDTDVVSRDESRPDKYVGSEAVRPDTDVASQPIQIRHGCRVDPTDLSDHSSISIKNSKEDTAPKNGAPIFGQKPTPKLTPGEVCKVIAEAGGLEFDRPLDKDLANSKRLLKDHPELTADDVASVVAYMLGENPDFWNRKTPIDPAAIRKHLPLYRKAQAPKTEKPKYLTGLPGASQRLTRISRTRPGLCKRQEWAFKSGRGTRL